MNSKIIVALLCLLIQHRLSAQQESITLTLRGCSVQGDTLSALDPESFSFGFDAHFEVNDTLKAKVIHYRGTSARSLVNYSFREVKDTIKVITSELKAGDGFYFIFLLRGVEVLRKNFYVASTIHSLRKPYYFDLYFIYNEDSVAVDQYILGTRMKFERHHNFKRIFFNDPKEFKRNFELIKKTYLTEFNFSTYSIYHGKVTVRFLDQKPLIEKYGYELSVGVTDMDRNTPLEWTSETKSGGR